jgi:hypothetical protein
LIGRWKLTTPDFLKAWGAKLSLIAGVVMGVMDIFQGFKEFADGNKNGLAGAYFVSGVLGIALGWALSAAALGPLAWIVIGIGFALWIGVSYLIAKNSDTPLQTWFSRCSFGTAPAAEKYEDAKEQAEYYQQALAG